VSPEKETEESESSGERPIARSTTDKVVASGGVKLFPTNPTPESDHDRSSQDGERDHHRESDSKALIVHSSAVDSDDDRAGGRRGDRESRFTDRDGDRYSDRGRDDRDNRRRGGDDRESDRRRGEDRENDRRRGEERVTLMLELGVTGFAQLCFVATDGS